MTRIRVEKLGASHLEAWAALFEATSSGCFCRYWHCTGTKNDWLERCAIAPEQNRAEHEAALKAGDPSARGLIAIEGDRVIGWMKLAPRAVLPKLRNLSVYRSLDLGDDAGAYAVGCFVVHPEFRGRGVARALIAAAGEHVRSWGGTAIEAYPRHAIEPMHPEEVWMGPEAIFVEAGFRAIAGEVAYPVYRKALD